MAKKRPQLEVPQRIVPRSMDTISRVSADGSLAPQVRPVAPPPRPERPQPLPPRPGSPRPQAAAPKPVEPVTPVVPSQPAIPSLEQPLVTPERVTRKPRRRLGRLVLQIIAWLFVIVAVAAAVIEL